MPRLTVIKSADQLLILAILLLPLPNPVAAAISDLLIAMETDGRSHTVQHTIGSNGTVIELELPGSVIPQEVRFIGPDQAEQAAQYQGNPRKLQLNSGSAFARYHHQYGQDVTQSAENEYELTTLSRPANITIYSGTLEESSMTWVFPTDFEITSYTVTDSQTGKWVVENNMLTFHQLSDEAVTLSIRYRFKPASKQANNDVCSEVTAKIDACAPDNDADGVPDYRDICLNSNASKIGILGCRDDNSLVLDAVKFTSGNSYLEVSARQLLDRVAHAIQKYPGIYFEIGAHTDNHGAANFNLKLSGKRAEAVRHYLMLKGVDPNGVRATGYGESYPVKDNATSAGRRANRRIELTHIKK
ncbi:MAG: OmpA family protein [Granulosicoccaceae bacterium]